MALDSILCIDANVSIEAVRDKLTEIGFVRLFDDEDGVRVGTDGVMVVIYASPIFDNQLREAGISATVELFFANSDNRLADEWTLNTVRAVMALLHAFPGDALFMYCSDSAALLRKDGRIILDRRAGLWDEGVEPEVLSLVDLPYTFGTIPVT